MLQINWPFFMIQSYLPDNFCNKYLCTFHRLHLGYSNTIKSPINTLWCGRYIWWSHRRMDIGKLPCLSLYFWMIHTYVSTSMHIIVFMLIPFTGSISRQKSICCSDHAHSGHGCLVCLWRSVLMYLYVCDVFIFRVWNHSTVKWNSFVHCR